MSTESNKALALEYLKRLEAGDFDAAFGMIADDGKVWVAGRTAPRDEFAKIVRSFRADAVTAPACSSRTMTSRTGRSPILDTMPLTVTTG